MKDREQPHSSASLRKALRCLSLLLLPAMIIEEGHGAPGLRSTMSPGAEPTPYLPVLGSPSLRFQEELPPPDLATRPPASAPPVPALTPAENSVATANAAAAHLTGAPAPVAAPKASPVPVPVEKTPAPILPDSTRPVVHPEDFLPYFQIPGSSAPAAPQPGQLPPSSASYTQTPQ